MQTSIKIVISLSKRTGSWNCKLFYVKQWFFLFFLILLLPYFRLNVLKPESVFKQLQGSFQISLQKGSPCELEEPETHSSKSAGCPREHCVLLTCMHTHHSFINLCTQDIAELCFQFCLHFWWTGVEPIFPFCVFCRWPQCTPNQRIESLSLSLSLLSLTLYFSLFLCLFLFLSLFHFFSPLFRVSAEANWQRLWDRFWQDFEHSECRSFQTVLLFVCLCMAAYNLALLLSFSAQKCLD